MSWGIGDRGRLTGRAGPGESPESPRPRLPSRVSRRVRRAYIRAVEDPADGVPCARRSLVGHGGG